MTDDELEKAVLKIEGRAAEKIPGPWSTRYVRRFAQLVADVLELCKIARKHVELRRKLKELVSDERADGVDVKAIEALLREQKGKGR